MTSLLIENVVKRYGDMQTVRGVSLSVAAGERVALLGHNGAGKTTLMRMVLGLTTISSGAISVLGATPGSAAARKATGFLPENVAFHGALSGREQLHYFARLKSEPLRTADEFLERVGLADAADRKIRTYSKGMRQRVGLAQALLGRPKLALLDEPTSGLDPISRHEFYDIVDDLATGGTAVLLSSHALTNLETRTDRIVIMAKGRCVVDDTLANLRHGSVMPIHMRVTVAAGEIDPVIAAIGGERLSNNTVSLTCTQDEKMALLARITGLGDVVNDIDITPASLEDLYRHYSTNKEGI